MKKALQISLILSTSLVLTACGKEGAFKSAINKELEGEYKCLGAIETNVSGFYAPVDLDGKVLREALDKNTAVFVQIKKNGKLEPLSVSEKKQVDALELLVKVGLLKKTQETQPGIDRWRQKPVEGEEFVMDLYNLTEAGQKTVKQQGTYQGKGTFCYAYPQVDKILNYVEQDVVGQKMAEIKYSYKYVDIASWAKEDKVKATFPEIEQALNKADKTGKIDLVKTNNGWSTGL